MTVTYRRSTWLVAGMLWALGSGAPVVADDTELFVVDASLFPDARPNVLLIIDTSGSMRGEILTQPTYVPTTIYTGSCPNGRVYWRDVTGGGSSSPPACSSSNWFDLSAFTCGAAIQAFASSGYYVADRMGQYDPATDDRWETIDANQKSRLVECQDDSGVHGDGVDLAKVYARNGDDTQLWSAAPGAVVSWGASPLNRLYTTYSTNFLNWYYGARLESIPKIDIVKDVATNLLDTVNGINVGLMRYNTNISSTTNGGAVIFAMEDIATGREANASARGTPSSGNTSITSTCWERTWRSSWTSSRRTTSR